MLVSYQASAPGSLMLLGEHAVLHGEKALVCALSKRITVTLLPRTDQQIVIRSDKGSFTTQLNQLAVTKPLQFVLGALVHYRANLQTGCELVIESEFSDQVGLGSSAAVTVATVAVIRAWLSYSMDKNELTNAAIAVIRAVQGLGSGADVAAAVYGGMIAYCAQPLQVETFSQLHPLTVVYSGYKTPTVEVVKHVQNTFAACPDILQRICLRIGACTQQAIQLLRAGRITACGEIMNRQQGLMEELGVSNPLLNKLVAYLCQQSTISGAKISGSGLGDCVIGWGKSDNLIFIENGVCSISVDMSAQGVLVFAE
ncbi:MAG: mevalonate kinase [Gammaproteobacteria bacterium RIFCSPHIGHO2_12_FULL_41_20]|nr:MAG: mevalonate kinase [Gammaproteobacteria bacterium RIFCSPHIGHO2_12_FULL_41_20]